MSQETINCALRGYEEERKKWEQAVEDLKDKAKEAAAKQVIKKLLTEAIKKGTGVSLGLAGSIPGAVGEAVGALVGETLVATMKRLLDARAKVPAGELSQDAGWIDNGTLPKAKDQSVGNFSRTLAVVGSAKGIGAKITVAFDGPMSGGKQLSIAHPDTLNLTPDGLSHATQDAYKAASYTLDSARILSIDPYCKKWWHVPVITSQDIAISAVSKVKTGDAMLIYVAYVCVHGECVSRKDLGLGRWEWLGMSSKKRLKLAKDWLKKKKKEEEGEESESWEEGEGE